MEFTLLDNKPGNWSLAKSNLWDYLSSVDTEKFMFDIQRNIVVNSFLDSLYITVREDNPIPPITIATKNTTMLEQNTIAVEDFSIVDGLQRTYRLWLYKRIVELSRENSGDWKETVNQLNALPEYSRGFYTINRIKEIIDKAEEVEQRFRTYNVYFYIWENLSQTQLIKLMLTLNVGAKRVSRTHQYELIFLNVYKQGSSLSKDVKLIRSKEVSFSKIRSGERAVGELAFPSVMVGFQSLLEGRPLRIDTSDFNLENVEDDSLIEANAVENMFRENNLKQYLSGLFKLDSILSEYGKNVKYLKWFVKDTTIAGIMGAIGVKMRCEGNVQEFWFDRLIEQLNKVGNDPYRLDEFDRCYKTLPSTRINIGKVVRNAIYYYTIGIIDGVHQSWSYTFTISLPKNQQI